MACLCFYLRLLSCYLIYMEGLRLLLFACCCVTWFPLRRAATCSAHVLCSASICSRLLSMPYIPIVVFYFILKCVSWFAALFGRPTSHLNRDCRWKLAFFCNSGTFPIVFINMYCPRERERQRQRHGVQLKKNMKKRCKNKKQCVNVTCTKIFQN